MSQYNVSGHKGFVATSALAANVLVKISGSGVVVTTNAVTDKPVGFTTNAAEAGETVDVRLVSAQGTTKAKISGTVAVGDFVTSAGSGGTLITTTTATNRVVGQALEAGVTGDVIEVLNCNFVL